MVRCEPADIITVGNAMSNEAMVFVSEPGTSKSSREIVRYPAYLAAVKSFVKQHQHRKEQPVHLAIYYAGKRHVADVQLLEVVGGFGSDRVDPGRKFFEFVYGSTLGFPLPSKAYLRLILTNPKEFQEAIASKWKAITELRESFRRGRAQVIFADRLGRKLRGLL